MFVRKALLLVILTVLEIFYQEFVRKPYFWLRLQYKEYFTKNCAEKPSYSTRNILTKLVQKSHTFGYSYSTKYKNINKICAHHEKDLFLVNSTVIKILNPLRRPRGFRQYRAPSWFIYIVWLFCNLRSFNLYLSRL